MYDSHMSRREIVISEDNIRACGARYWRQLPRTEREALVAASEGFLETMAEVTMYLLASKDADEAANESTGLMIHSCSWEW